MNEKGSELLKCLTMSAAACLPTKIKLAMQIEYYATTTAPWLRATTTGEQAWPEIHYLQFMDLF